MKFDRLRLVTRRARLNMTQESLAAAAEVSLRSVAAWEAGTQLPTLRMVNKLADALNVSADWLLGGDAKDSMQASSSVSTLAEPSAGYGEHRPPAPAWIRDLVERLSAMDAGLRERAIRQFHLTLDLLMSAGVERRVRHHFSGHDLADDPVSGIDPEVAETLRAGVRTAHRIAADRAAGRDEGSKSDRPEPKPKLGHGTSRQSEPAKPSPMKTS